MDIKQKTYLEVNVDDKIIQLVLDSDTPLGSLHDALMYMKGYCVDRMIKAHKEEEEESKKQLGKDEEE